MFWVQIHGLPALWQKAIHLHNIGKKVGIVQITNFDNEESQSWKKFNRIRVKLNISKPLTLGIFLPCKGRNDLWIGIKYEKLPDLCYNCGCIGHYTKDCSSGLVTLSNQFGFRFKAFGVWLYAGNVSSPPDIYEKNCLVPIEAILVEQPVGTIDMQSEPKKCTLIGSSVPVPLVVIYMCNQATESMVSAIDCTVTTHMSNSS